MESGTLDHKPWVGGHAEDILSEQTIKHGHSVRSQLVAESATARPTLWPHLRNASSLDNLTKLFGDLRHGRAARGNIVSTSTFKPPPRVTLTDQKREAWLRDLANPGVPLRKQSRTIPHGVKGKVLLEQCLVKRISMTRAVWLARCVGANELRAFRRKGVSTTTVHDNEIRWTRDWTTLVEAFVDDHLEFSGQVDFKRSLTYV